MQSAYRRFHSSETALLKTIMDALSAIDKGDIGLLLLMDLSAAFDTVDHAILLHKLEHVYGIRGFALAWLESYLNGRSCYVKTKSGISTEVLSLFGLPQGSVLGPLLFILYVAELLLIIDSAGLSPFAFADDTQVLGICRPVDFLSLQDRMSSCMLQVERWMSSHRLQLNPKKTELIWIYNRYRPFRPPDTAIIICGEPIVPSKSVKSLGIIIDAELRMNKQVGHTIKACYAILRNIRSIRSSLTPSMIKTLVATIMLPKLDYCNSVLMGKPTSSLEKLNSVIKASVRLIYSIPKFDHITTSLKRAHFLLAKERIDYKVAMLVFKVLRGLAPDYLTSELYLRSDISSRRDLRSANKHLLHVPRKFCKTIGDCAFSVYGPRLWNTLPSSLTSVDSLETFKSKLKTYLFHKSFNLSVQCC